MVIEVLAALPGARAAAALSSRCSAKTGYIFHALARRALSFKRGAAACSNCSPLPHSCRCTQAMPAKYCRRGSAGCTLCSFNACQPRGIQSSHGLLHAHEKALCLQRSQGLRIAYQLLPDKVASCAQRWHRLAARSACGRQTGTPVAICRATLTRRVAVARHRAATAPR